MKKGIRYLRFSYDGQSASSIERQDALTSYWMNNNNVTIVDTFVDAGYSARTFDRPDIKQLFDFIKRNHRGIDYLVVSELTRFSRETGDAINMVKKIQLTYGVRIVSTSRNAIYDVTEHTSFFMMVLEFGLGHSDNIKRINDINGGIYTAKVDEGRYISGKTPFGLKKEGIRKEMKFVIIEHEAKIVRYIYSSFLNHTPAYIIKKRAVEMGLNKTGNFIIQEILQNPIYSAQQKVKPYKDRPGGIFPAKNVEQIIALSDWNEVQSRFNKGRERVTVVERIPLRGVLRCWCGKLLTGAASRGNGGHYYYYKCVTSAHNHFNADRAHEKMGQLLEHMSLTDWMITAIRQNSEALFSEKLVENKKLLSKKLNELQAEEKLLHSVEEKWIKEQLSYDAYQKWHRDLSQKISSIRGSVQLLSREQDEVYTLLKSNIDLLGNLKTVYDAADIIEKQQLLRMGFDNSLYYKEGIYRTKYMMRIFEHNKLILRKKQLLIVDELRQKSDKVDCIRFELMTPTLSK